MELEKIKEKLTTITFGSYAIGFVINLVGLGLNSKILMFITYAFMLIFIISLPLRIIVGIILAIQTKRWVKLFNYFIVILGISLLISIPMPMFKDAIAKSRASEASHILSQISIKEKEYFEEKNHYFQSDSFDEIKDTLNLADSPVYFEYYIDTADGGFKAYAKVNKKIGKVPIGSYLWCDQDGNKGISDSSIIRVLPAWYYR